MADRISKVYLSSDHAGIELRQTVASHLEAAGYAVEDLGPDAGISVDYPDYGAKLGPRCAVTPQRGELRFVAAALGFQWR